MPITASDIRDWTIYKITSPSNRVYVGISSNYKKRYDSYLYMKKQTQPILYKSFNKYGVRNHKFEVIDTFKSDRLFANGKEIFWIKTFMSNINMFPDQYGMNLTMGGDGQLGRKMSDESKKKISNNKKGCIPTAFQLSQALKANIGNKYNLGRFQSEETKKKRIDKLKGRKMGESELAMRREMNIRLNGKPIIVTNIETGEIHEFTHLNAAVPFVNMDRNTITRHLCGTFKREPNIKNRKFIFKYK